MIVKLLTEHHLEFLSLKGGCRGSSESTHVKIPHCQKSHVMAQMVPLISSPEHDVLKVTFLDRLEVWCRSSCTTELILPNYTEMFPV